MPGIPSRRLLPLTSPRSFIEEYETLSYLCSGSFGDVWVCRGNATGDEFACKVLAKARITTDAQRQEVRREVKVMAALQGSGAAGGDSSHPGVVGLREVMETDTEIRMVMELCKGGDLYNLLVTRGPLPEDSARMVFRQVASALAHCHSLGVVHRDLKPENILFDQRALGLYSSTSAGLPRVQAKLADFGLSVLLGQGKSSTTGCAGSLHYVAPEILQGLPYNSKVDMWSLGVTLCAMLTARLPFSGPGGDEDMKGLVETILRGHVDWQKPHWRHVSASAKSLVLLLLDQDPVQRPSADEVLAHPWLAVESRSAGRRYQCQLSMLQKKANCTRQVLPPWQATAESSGMAQDACTWDGSEWGRNAAGGPTLLGGSAWAEEEDWQPLNAARYGPNKENWRVPRAPPDRKLTSTCQTDRNTAHDNMGNYDRNYDSQLVRGVTPRSRRIGNMILRGVQAC